MPARLSTAAASYIKDVFPEEDHNLGHVRRFMVEDGFHVEGQDQTTWLRVLVCTEDYMDDKKEVEELLKPLVDKAKGFEIKPKKPKNGEAPKESEFVDLYYEAKVEQRTTARYAPETKQESADWSKQTGWPLMWRGNTAAIPTAMSERDQEQAMKYLKQVTSESVSSPYGIATLIVDPDQDLAVAVSTDVRSEKDPLKHSTMAAIEKAAAWRKSLKDDDGYLCRGFHVYTTHEPCPMCAMALLHSRVNRIIYIKPTPKTGAIEPESSGLCIHAQHQLNWQFEAWKYSGGSDDAELDLGSTAHITAVPEGYNV